MTSINSDYVNGNYRGCLGRKWGFDNFWKFSFSIAGHFYDVTNFGTIRKYIRYFLKTLIFFHLANWNNELRSRSTRSRTLKMGKHDVLLGFSKCYMGFLKILPILGGPKLKKQQICPKLSNMTPIFRVLMPNLPNEKNQCFRLYIGNP